MKKSLFFAAICSCMLGAGTLVQAQTTPLQGGDTTKVKMNDKRAKMKGDNGKAKVNRKKDKARVKGNMTVNPQM